MPRGFVAYHKIFPAAAVQAKFARRKLHKTPPKLPRLVERPYADRVPPAKRGSRRDAP